MTDIAKMLRGPATVKDEMTAIYLSAKDARRAADYVERLEAENTRLLEVLRSIADREYVRGPALSTAALVARAALQDTTT